MTRHNIRYSQQTATPEQVVECARTYLGTPYGDFGRVKGVALDCIGLPILVGKELGLFSGDFAAYTPTPKQQHAKNMADDLMGEVVFHREGWPEIRAGLQPVAPEYRRAGDVGLFWFSNRSEPTHFCIFAQHPLDPSVTTMIHAHARLKKCIEVSMDEFWHRRHVSTYRLPNVKG